MGVKVKMQMRKKGKDKRVTLFASTSDTLATVFNSGDENSLSRVPCHPRWLM